MPRELALLDTPQTMQAWRRGFSAGRVGFVPTMGALHEGHASLLKRLRPDCDLLVLSIFVNPTQFGPEEDLAKYPRTLEADLRVAKECGVDAVFLPSAPQLYPSGFSTYVEELTLTQDLCGKFRPGHFRGVTTVVLKLFNLVKPAVAYFGLKDAQQFFVLHKMTRELDLGISVEGVATVREADGLAMSSRNRFLTAENRVRAAILPEVLRTLAARLETAAVPAAQCLSEARDGLVAKGFKIQYLECVTLPSFQTCTEFSASQPYMIAVAAFLGGTRLIDNVILRPELLINYGIRVHLD